MKIKSLLMMTAVLAMLQLANASEENAEALFKANCATCHSLTQPKDRSKMVAPPARGVMFHLSQAFQSKEKIKAHIEDFVIHPSAEKAICQSVKRFGVMPSLQGAISDDDLQEISEWMIENLMMNQAEHNAMQKRRHQGAGKGMKKGGFSGKPIGKSKGSCTKG